MRDFARIVTRINSAAWLMTEEGINSILGILERHMMDDEEEIKRHIALIDPGDDRDGGPQIVNGVGVLGLYGPIFPKANLMTELSGATSLEQFRSDFRTLVDNGGVHSILLDIDSPGGVSDLVMETAAKIRAARDIKPVITIANTMAASAAAWIASAGSESYITDSGLGGSIGVYTVHIDTTEKDKMAGIKKTVIKSGDRKAGHEEALNEHTRANLQENVDDLFKDFVTEVSTNRGRDITDIAHGGIITPRKGVEKGLFDGIKTFESLLSEMTENGGVVGSTTAAVAMSGLARHGYIQMDEHTEAWVRSQIGDRSASLEQEKSHGDPGPQGEPIPREPAETGDKAIEGGWRVPTPPQPSFPPASHVPPPKYKSTEGSTMNREQLVALAQRLNIQFDDSTTDEELWAKITSEVDEVVVPLNAASASVEAARNFERDYPDHARELSRLRERDEETEARQFASNWERFVISEGETRRKTTNGFSARVLGHISDIHLKLTRRQLQESDLTLLLDSIAEHGVVDYGEHGSARDVAERVSLTGMTVKEKRQAFADELKKIMTEDGVDRRTAIKLVGERNPELAEAYKIGHVRR